MTEKGKNIMKVIEYMQTFFEEIAQVIEKMDDYMEKDGWNPFHGNTITSGMSKSLEYASNWLPYMNFRVYQKKVYPNLIKGITIVYDSDRIEEPIIIGGFIDYKDEFKSKRHHAIDYWILWHLWLDDKNESKSLDGKVYTDFNHEDMNKIKRIKLFANRLMDIKNEADIKNKIFNKLSKMK